MAADTTTATTRLVLPDHAEAVMRQVEDLQWTETFSDLAIHVSQTIMFYISSSLRLLNFILVSRWRGAVPPHYGMRHQSNVKVYSLGTGVR